MTNIVIIKSNIHRDLRVRAQPSARYGDAQRFVAVVLNEFPFLAAHYPIFFNKDSETGRFFIGAVLGFDEGENLFLGESGIGVDTYRPLNAKRVPFWTVGNDLAIDLDHPRVGDGEALFDGDGKPTSYLESIIAAMRELKAGEEQNKIFIDTLMDLKLIEPIDMNIELDDGSKRQVTGLYTVARETLRNLPDDKVLNLFRRGYLHLIFLMIDSVRQVSVLAQMKNRRLREGTGTLGGASG